MRAYKTLKGLTHFDGLPNFYHKDKIEKLEKLGFKRDFGYFIKNIGNFRVWIDTNKGGYIDYQDVYSGNRIAPNQIDLKKHKELAILIKEIKLIGVIE